MKVTVGVIAYNEQDNIGALLDCLNSQTYPHNDIEIILVDGMSTDGTKKMMSEFADSNDFWQVKVIDNPKKVQPAGWNCVIDNAQGDVIIRLDAHSIIPNDFVEENVKCIESGESVCGGKLEHIIKNDSKMVSILLSAENSMFGSSPAAFRRSDKKEYVKTLAQGCYKREVFDKAGKFNEKLLRAEDNEMHYRIRKAGYKICLSDRISYQYISRPTLGRILKQKYGNGKWIGITSLKIGFGVFSLYHFIPMLFVLGMIASIAVALVGIAVPTIALFLALPLIVAGGSYILLLLAISILESIKAKSLLSLLLLPIIISMLHITYGVGTVVGVMKAPFVRIK